MPAEKKQIRHKARGHTFFLKKVEKAMVLMALSEGDKPKPPMVEVTYAGDVTAMQPNPQDPQYLQDLEIWNGQHNSRLFRICVVYGIDRVTNAKGEPAKMTPEEEAEIRFVYGDNLPMSSVQFYWMAKLIGNTAAGFMNLVMGQTEVTMEGLEEEEDRFRPDGEGPGIHGEGDAVQTDGQMEDSFPE